MDKKILSRIQKLLALAGSDPNTPEAISASRKAAELMAQHRIGYEDVKDDGTIDDSGMIEEEVTANARHHQIWESKLSRLLCDVFECQAIVSGTARHNTRTRGFIGTKSDVSILVWFFKYLRLRIAKQAEKQFRLQVDQKEFGIGCVDTLAPRICDMYKRKKEVIKSTCTDIMVIGKAVAVKGYFNKLYPITNKVGYSHSGGSRQARSAGMVAGNTMSINQQIR